MKKIAVFLCVLFLAFLSVNASYAGPGCKDLTGEIGVDGVTKYIDSGGITNRSYILYVPTGLNKNKPTPLVFDFHGYKMGAAYHYNYSQMWLVAEKYKFILVTPLGTTNLPYELGFGWNGGACCYPATGDPETPFGDGHDLLTPVDDVGFVSDMIDEIMIDYCIDPKRIFAAGFSNGGGMSIRLACELSVVSDHRIAAIAAVASAGTAIPACLSAPPFPIIAFKGTADSSYEAALYNIDLARQHNGCSDKTKIYFQEGDVTCKIYKGCHQNAKVAFCEIQDGGHNWPGADEQWWSGYTTEDIDASTAIWKFFAKHSIPDEGD
jgi:polyhydroxybutyrate depolymerase